MPDAIANHDAAPLEDSDRAALPHFADRREAGAALAERLGDLRSAHPVVLGLLRGGIVVADAVARALDAPLEPLVVRKVGYPWQPELAAGAIAEAGAVYPPELEPVVEGEREQSQLAGAASDARATLESRLEHYRPRGPLDLRDRTAIVVDDGLATGSTLCAALIAVRRLGASRIVAAIPIASSEGVDRAATFCDELRALAVAPPGWFFAVGSYYDDFAQVEDAEVDRILATASHRIPKQEVSG